jgi:hypothetical protein
MTAVADRPAANDMAAQVGGAKAGRRLSTKITMNSTTVIFVMSANSVTKLRPCAAQSYYRLFARCAAGDWARTGLLANERKVPSAIKSAGSPLPHVFGMAWRSEWWSITAAGKPGPEKRHGTYVVEFRTAAGVLALPIPRTEAGVIRHLQERMPSGLFVPDVP